MHFNENVQREKRQTKAGTVHYNVIYPKYKFGEEVVREIAAPPTYVKLNKTKMVHHFYEFNESMKMLFFNENAVLHTYLSNPIQGCATWGEGQLVRGRGPWHAGIAKF